MCQQSMPGLLEREGGEFHDTFFEGPLQTLERVTNCQRKALHWKLEFSCYESLDLFVPCAAPQGRSIRWIL